MRVAPVGLFACRTGHASLEERFCLGCDLAAITHGHRTGFLTASVLAVLIHALAAGNSLSEALAQAKHRLEREAPRGNPERDRRGLTDGRNPD